MTPLQRFVEAELATPAPEPVVRLAAALAGPARDAAILYYGSTLRTGDLTGVLDFYRLTRGPHRRGLRGLVERLLWPEVSYHEVDGLKAKVATLPLATFARAAAGRTLDTTIWARFVQPAQCVWAADDACAAAARDAVAAAVATAGRFAAKLGPDSGPPGDYWSALFRRTYAAEFRMEAVGRAETVLAHATERYAALLPLAWDAAGVRFTRAGEGAGGSLCPQKRGLPGWALPNLVGKPLNVARILKAAFTFDGAARYAAYKIARHTGVEIDVTPWRERHPFLAAPGAWLELRRRQRER